MDFVVLEWLSNDFWTINSKVITDNRSKGDSEAIRIPSIVCQLAQSLGKYCMCKVVLVLGLLVIGWKIGVRFITQSLSVAIAIIILLLSAVIWKLPNLLLLQLHWLPVYLSLVCVFFSEVSSVSPPSICNLMWIIWVNCLILLNLNARKSQGMKQFHRLHVDPLSY